MQLSQIRMCFHILLYIIIPLSPVALIRFLGAWMDRNRKQVYIWACILLAIAMCLYFNLYLYLI